MAKAMRPSTVFVSPKMYEQLVEEGMRQPNFAGVAIAIDESLSARERGKTLAVAFPLEDQNNGGSDGSTPAA